MEMQTASTALTSVDIFYIVLTIFVTIIWTMLIVVLKRLLFILSVWEEIAGYFVKIKWFLNYYENIAELYFDKIKNIMK